ncbi:2-oxo acid dehydrogenase acyltransferase [Teladorsagia circumcincta]|uniref:Dihydrolipoamide acetyltransferase component of pyruvate dehydrogenase complex n=1 Tax=Teladorsagia circumcincta TaxID=45464 RepID=A0A2G9UMD0_TELCI|nr:2-oxo acid dehydrogenase acyltransferase [Teladorsagia circumcincta]
MKTKTQRLHIKQSELVVVGKDKKCLSSFSGKMSKFPARGFPLRTIGGLRYGLAASSAANLSVAPQSRAASTSRLSPLFGGPSKNVPRPTAVVRSKEGDQLSEGDLLCEIETDKATMGFETPEEGYLAKIIIHEGSKDIPVGKGVTGSGPGGRVLAADLAKAPDSAAAQAASTPAAPGADYTDIPVSNMRRTIAKRLTASKTTIPHYYLTAEINIDSLLKVREKLNTLLAQGTSNGKTKISVNDFIVKGLATISSEIKELAARAKDGKLQPNEFQVRYQ